MFCACDCGEVVDLTKRFIRGHNARTGPRGPMPEHVKKKISETKGGWTETEMRILFENYASHSAKEMVALLPNRTRSSIETIAWKKGLAKRIGEKLSQRHTKPWNYSGISRKTQNKQNRAIRRARIKRGTIDSVSYDDILARDGHRCGICHRRVKPENISFDHVIPLSDGGSHTFNNIQVAHLKCNMKKSSKRLTLF